MRVRRSKVIFTIRLCGRGGSLSGESNLVSLKGTGSLSLRPSSWTTTACRQPLVLAPLPLGGTPWLCAKGTRAKGSGLRASACSFVGSRPAGALQGAGGGGLLCFFRSPGVGTAGLDSWPAPERGLPFVFTLGLSLAVCCTESRARPGSLSTCRPACEWAWPATLVGFLGCLVPRVCLSKGSWGAGDFWQLLFPEWEPSGGIRGALLEFLAVGSLGSACSCPVVPLSLPPLPSWCRRTGSGRPRPSGSAAGWLTLVNQLSNCHLLVVGGSGSGAGVSRGSFSSLSLELLSLSESEELSESLLLSDSALLECADATGCGSDWGALGGAAEEGGFSGVCSLSLSSLSLS